MHRCTAGDVTQQFSPSSDCSYGRTRMHCSEFPARRNRCTTHMLGMRPTGHHTTGIEGPDSHSLPRNPGAGGASAVRWSQGFAKLSKSKFTSDPDVTGIVLREAHKRVPLSSRLTRIVPRRFRDPIAGACLLRSRVQFHQTLRAATHRRGEGCSCLLEGIQMLQIVSVMSGAVFMPTPAGFTGQIEPAADAHIEGAACPAAEAAGALLQTGPEHGFADKCTP